MTRLHAGNLYTGSLRTVVGAAVHNPGPRPMLRWFAGRVGHGAAPALFCDRDGVLNRRNPDGYITRPPDVELLPTAIGAALAAQRVGAPVVIVSNQGVIARGLAEVAEVEAVNHHLIGLLAGHGVVIDGVYVCPHHPDAPAVADRSCACRKPLPGLLVAAAADLHIDLSRSLLIGDQPSDLAAATAAGLAPGRRLMVTEDDDPDSVARWTEAALLPDPRV